jgi:hypothetical protein
MFQTVTFAFGQETLAETWKYPKVENVIKKDICFEKVSFEQVKTWMTSLSYIGVNAERPTSWISDHSHVRPPFNKNNSSPP